MMKTLNLLLLLGKVRSVMILQDCPMNEIYNSCNIREEYTCWDSKYKINRVWAFPKQLPYCVEGCYCRSDKVREYPGGACISQYLCHDNKLMEILHHLPIGFSDS